MCIIIQTEEKKNTELNICDKGINSGREEIVPALRISQNHNLQNLKKKRKRERKKKHQRRIKVSGSSRRAFIISRVYNFFSSRLRYVTQARRRNSPPGIVYCAKTYTLYPTTVTLNSCEPSVNQAWREMRGVS